MPEIQRSELQEAKRQAVEEHEWLCRQGPTIEQDRLAWCLRAYRFKTTIVAGRPLWRHVGKYREWKEFEQHICKLMQIKRATFYQNMRMVAELPPERIKQIGKSKGFIEARLKRKGKLTPAVRERIEKAPTVEDASEVAREVESSGKEGRRKLCFMPLVSQYNVITVQLHRVKQALGLGTQEEALDAIFGGIGTMSDVQIRAEFGGGE